MTSQELEKARPDGPKGRHYTASEVDAQAMEALRLKVLGTRDVDIAAALGLSRPTVAKRIRHAVETHGPTNVTAYREIAKQRYEAGLTKLVPLMAEGNLDAIRLWFDGTAKYAKLVGAEAPVQAEVHVTVETEQEKQLRDLLAQAERDEKVRESEIVDAEVVE
jgi:DNA-binding Lrp family transcriptional regulator